ncbi:craniofacial development protein 2 [Biomphalaria glabrata]|nr:craniofacial development protein 2 [Biomphalaria glabrata]
MVKQSLAKKLLDIPVGHSDRLMSLRLPLYGSRYVTIISAYAPTLPAEPETKERFYDDLRRVLCKVNTTDKLYYHGRLQRSSGERLQRLARCPRLADVRERFSVLLEADLRKPQYNDPDSNWSQLKAILQDVMAKVVGYCSKPNRDWFDENNTAINELLMNKHKYYRSVLANPNDISARTLYKASCHTLQSKIRELKNNCKADILNRWTEHYSMLFGDKRHVLEKSLANVPQKTIKEKLDDRPTFEEFETAISKLKKKKKTDGLPAEIFKMGFVVLTERLTDLFALWSHLNFEIP